MAKKGKIVHYREMLDRTLASHDLTDEKKLGTLVKDQILRSAEDTGRGLGYADGVIAKRTAEVSNFLEMLRSASESCDASPNLSHYPSWKLKQDTEELRVMYREGPIGSPFHSLLVEGYVDAALDVCLCVSWEAALYTRWFPEILIPTFKVVVAKSLQKVRIGEEISLVRMKLSWPLSSREAILHCFEFEYLQDGLVLVLMNSISDVENIQWETHGFTNEGIPELENTVRLDLMGGFALQKVTENRSYFRTIANMDIKLDFVPPSLINFISRQLIGSGFRLYQKIVASVSRGDEAFAKALSDPFYDGIRKGLFSNSETKRNVETKIIQEYNNAANDEEQRLALQDVFRKEDANVLPNDLVNKSLHEHEPLSNEIEEEDVTENQQIKENKQVVHEKILGNMFTTEDQMIQCNGHTNGYSLQVKPATEIEEEINEGENVVMNDTVDNIEDKNEGSNSIDNFQSENLHRKVPISPQVELALGTLDKMINVVREGRFKTVGQAQSSPGKEDETEYSTKENLMKWADKGVTSAGGLAKPIKHAPGNGIAVGDLRLTSSDFHSREANHVPMSAVKNPPTANWARHSTSVGSSQVFVSPMTGEANSIPEKDSIASKKIGQPKKWRLCCLHLISGRVVS